MALKKKPRVPLTASERKGIITAVESAFLKLNNLYKKIAPIFVSFGFTPQAAGVIARDLSEKVEASIIQHCDSFKKGNGHCDLGRFNTDWEVKVCKDSGLTINQSKVIDGENYIVVNYGKDTDVKRIFILWEAKDSFFSGKKSNSNARRLNMEAGQNNIEIIFPAPQLPK